LQLTLSKLKIELRIFLSSHWDTSRHEVLVTLQQSSHRDALSESLYGMATVTRDSQSVHVVCGRPMLRITTRV